MKKFIFSFVIALSLTACGGNTSGVNGGASLPSEDGGSADQSNPTNPTNPSTPLLPADYSYSAKSEPLAIFGMNQERQILSFDMQTQILKVSVPFPTLGILQVSGEVPNYPEIIFYTDMNNQSLVFEIPLAEYLNLLQSNTTLPDGRPIPGVPGGELPLLGLQLPNTSLNTTVYLGKDYLAFFMESDFNLPLNLTGNILNSDGSAIVGLLGWVAAKDGYKGGAFVSLRLPRELVAYIGSLQ
jgi:hypothetical protein